MASSRRRSDMASANRTTRRVERLCIAHRQESEDPPTDPGTHSPSNAHPACSSTPALPPARKASTYGGPNSSSFKIILYKEYSILVIEILSSISISSAPVILYITSSIPTLTYFSHLPPTTVFNLIFFVTCLGTKV